MLVVTGKAFAGRVAGASDPEVTHLRDPAEVFRHPQY
jgi:hypothetical protein